MNSRKLIKSKKGEEPAATSAGLIILIVAGLIIFYLLMVSPSERLRLLEGDSSFEGDGTISQGGSQSRFLIEENIGEIGKSPYSTKDHEMSAITISTTTDAQTVFEKSSIYVRNSAFTKSFPELVFDTNPELSKNLKLSFNVEKADGILTVYLNDNEIFTGRIRYTSPPAIELPQRYLEEENNLVFYLNRPSWAFWRIEEYELRDIKILGEITDVSKDSAQVDFAITDFDYDNLETTKLYFYPECLTTQVGKLDIHFNNIKVYSAIPDCGAINRIILEPTDFIIGRNTLNFGTQSGTYIVDQIKVRTDLKEQIYPTYYFDLERKYFYNADSNNNDDEDEEYKYFCDNDGTSILLRYEEDIEETGWECDTNENCLGNFEYYPSDKTENTILNILCEELDDDEYKYSCDDNERSILFKYEDDLENTGWNCQSGKICKGNYKIYDRERLKDIVREDICEYQDEEDIEEGFSEANAELKTNYDIEVIFRFPNNDFKELTIWTNGYKKLISTRDNDYSFFIDNYVYPGSNSIEIVPRTDNIKVSYMKVELKEN
jgi:hypothetical protein